MVMMVACTTELRISTEASNTTDNTPRRSWGGNAWFSRSRLYTFSTSMIASSTSEPMAMAIPPRLIVLMVSPIALSTSTAVSSERGSAMREMIVVRVLIRNRNSTMTTNSPPSNKAFCTLSIEFSIKFA